MSVDAATKKLDKLIELRHEIAHKVRTARPVTKRLVTAHSHFVKRLAGHLSNQVGTFVQGRTEKEPWIQVTYTGP